jgi:hypothetical protein
MIIIYDLCAVFFLVFPSDCHEAEFCTNCSRDGEQTDQRNSRYMNT